MQPLPAWWKAEQILERVNEMPSLNLAGEDGPHSKLDHLVVPIRRGNEGVGPDDATTSPLTSTNRTLASTTRYPSDGGLTPPPDTRYPDVRMRPRLQPGAHQDASLAQCHRRQRRARHR